MAQKTKIEKAGAIFETAADKTKKLRKKINLDEKELLNVLKENFKLLIKNIEQTGKITGVTLLWLSEYFVRVFNGLFISNALLRKTEKGFANIKPKKISAKDNIFKKMGAGITKALQESPTKYAYTSYYASLILLLGAAAMTDAARGEDSYIRGKFKEKDKKEIKKDEESIAKIDDFFLNPNASDEEWNRQINAIQPYVISHLLLTEGFIESTYSDKGNSGTLTFGIGFTIEDKAHKQFAEKILGRELSDKENISLEDAKKLTDLWLREKIYPKMKSAFKVPIDAKIFVSLAVAAYNAGESTYSIEGNSGVPVRDAVNARKSKEEIADLYVRQFGKIRKTQWGGMPNKYAVCALYMLGDISDNVILDCVGEAPYSIENYLKQDSVFLSQFDKNTMEAGRLLIYDGRGRKAKPCGIVRLENIEDLLLREQNRVTKGQRQLRISDYLTPHEVAVIKQGFVFEYDDKTYLLTAEEIAYVKNAFERGIKKIQQKEIKNSVLEQQSDLYLS